MRGYRPLAKVANSDRYLANSHRVAARETSDVAQRDATILFPTIVTT